LSIYFYRNLDEVLDIIKNELTKNGIDIKEFGINDIENLL